MVRAVIRSKKMLILLGAALVLLLAVACSSDNSGGGEPGTGGNVSAADLSSLLSATGGSEGVTRLLQSGSSSSTGIWVSGTGKASGIPDLGVISLGVESLEDTAAAARGQAAGAIDRSVSVLRRNDIDDRDIQTSHFNISPRYDTVERKWVLIGYQVTNTLTVKVRDLENMGDIIDSVTEAAGNLTRINRVHFTIEDPKPLQAQAREEAIADLLAKANAIARLAGIELGNLVFLTESGGGTPTPIARFEAAPALGLAVDQSTTILAGELDVRVNVQGVFNIAP